MRESAAAEQVAQASQSNLDARLRQVTGISGASNSPGQQRLPPSAQLQGRGPPTPSKEKKKDKSSCAVM